MSNRGRREEAARLLEWRLRWTAEQYAEMAQHFEDVRRFNGRMGTNEAKLREWLARVETWWASTLTKREYCARNGISERTLTHYIGKLDAKLPDEMRQLRAKYRG